MLQDAEEKWKKYVHKPGPEQCHKDYWNPSDQDNIDTSDLFRWWDAERLLQIQKDMALYRDVGEQEFFTTTMLGRPDIKCSVSQGGCDKQPDSCADVVDHIMVEEPELPLDKVLEKARRIYFMIYFIDEYYAIHNQIQVRFYSLITLKVLTSQRRHFCQIPSQEWTQKRELLSRT